MAAERRAAAHRDMDRIYSGIREDALRGIDEGQEQPKAVLVGGQPGAGRTYAAARVRSHLAGSKAGIVSISEEDLRAYHPLWRADQAAPADEAAIRKDVDSWHARLTGDAARRRAHLVLEAPTRLSQQLLAVTPHLRAAGYEVSAVIVATDRDQSRQSMLAQYDLARSAGLTPQSVPAASHDAAYAGVRELLVRMEAQVSVDKIQIIVADGRQLYANESDGPRWIRPVNGANVLDDFRERPLTARELANSALRWQTLVQRLASDPTVPRDVASQAIAWRDEAMQKAERDPQARQMVTWGREAEAFRTMSRRQFLTEFPQYGKPMERMDEALRYAEQNFKDASDRDRFIAEAREQLATRIAEGRYAAPERAADRGGRSR